MAEFIAIAHPFVYLPSKRDALLFDRIGMIGFNPDPDGEGTGRAVAELEWLAAQGVVFRTDVFVGGRQLPAWAAPYLEGSLTHVTLAAAADFISRDHRNRVLFDNEEKVLNRLEKFAALLPSFDVARVATNVHRGISEILAAPSAALPEVARASMIRAAHRTARLVALLHRIAFGTEAAPIGPVSPIDTAVALGTVESPVVRLVLDQLPVPSEDTPWEKVIEFRQDDDAKLALRRLRRWMKQAAAENAGRQELEDELQSLLDSYSEYMRIHKMKTTRGTIEAIVATVGDMAEALAKLKFGQIARTIFSASASRITLLEAELNAPGREIAYISKAKEYFRK